jgi:hypothetical protein
MDFDPNFDLMLQDDWRNLWRLEVHAVRWFTAIFKRERSIQEIIEHYSTPEQQSQFEKTAIFNSGAWKYLRIAPTTPSEYEDHIAQLYSTQLTVEQWKNILQSASLVFETYTEEFYEKKFLLQDVVLKFLDSSESWASWFSTLKCKPILYALKKIEASLNEYSDLTKKQEDEELCRQRPHFIQAEEDEDNGPRPF